MTAMMRYRLAEGPTNRRRTDDDADRFEGEALDKWTVAQLSADLIDRMTPDELARVVRSAELSTSSPSRFERSLPFYDRETLKRLAFLARRSCRNQGY